MTVDAERHQGQAECCQIKLVAEKDYERMHFFYVYITQSAIGPSLAKEALIKDITILFIFFYYIFSY